MSYYFADAGNALLIADLGVGNELTAENGAFLACWVRRGANRDTADAFIATGPDRNGSDWYIRPITTADNIAVTFNNSGYPQIDIGSRVDEWVPMLGVMRELSPGVEYDWVTWVEGQRSGTGGSATVGNSERYVGVGAGVQSSIVAPVDDAYIAHAVVGDFAPTNAEITRFMQGEHPLDIWGTKILHWSLAGGALTESNGGPSLAVDQGSPTSSTVEPPVWSKAGTGDNYYTDFSAVTTGQQPSDWTITTGFTTGSAQVVADTAAIGGKAFRVDGGATNEYNTIVWDGPSADADRAECEILTRVRSNSTTQPNIQLIGRGQDNGTTRTYAVWSDDGNFDRIRLCYEDNLTFGAYLNDPYTLNDETTYHYRRLRLQGQNIFYKEWEGRLLDEPFRWTKWANMVEDVEPDRVITAAGDIGLGSLADGADAYYDWIAVGVNGARAQYDSLPELTTQRVSPIRINSGNFTGSRSDWVMPIFNYHLPDEMLDTGSPFVAQSGGGDIRFSWDEEGYQRLPCEIVRFTPNATPNNAVVEIYVKLPYISDSADTYIYVHYSSSTSDSQPAVTEPDGRNAVWSDYEGVWHIQDSTVGLVDATGNNSTDLSETGSPTRSTTGGPGGLGSYLNFDGTDDYISSSSDYNKQQDNLATIFYNMPAVQDGGGERLFEVGGYQANLNSKGGGYGVEVSGVGGGDDIAGYIYGASGTETWLGGDNLVVTVTNEWTHAALASPWSTTDVTHEVRIKNATDGALINTGNETRAQDNGTDWFRLGVQPWNTANNKFQGYMAEFRIRKDIPGGVNSTELHNFLDLEYTSFIESPSWMARPGLPRYSTGDLVIQEIAKGGNAASFSIGADEGFTTPTAGNMLFAIVATSALGTTTPTDDGTGTWTLANEYDSSQANDNVQWFYKVAAGDETTITVDPATADANMCVLEMAASVSFAASPFHAASAGDQTASGYTIHTGNVSTTVPTFVIAAAVVKDKKNTVEGLDQPLTIRAWDQQQMYGQGGSDLGALHVATGFFSENLTNFGVTFDNDLTAVVKYAAVATFEDTSAGPVITDITDGTDRIFTDGQTGIDITGSNFGT